MKSLLQTKEWATLRQGYGWQAHWIDNILVLQKSLPFGKSFLYAPEVEWANINLQNFLQNIKKIAQNSKTIFFRLEILDENDTEIIEKLQKNKFVKAFEELQPEWRQIIDISKTEEEILAQMKPKGRYNIKVAQRSGVIVKKNDKIDEFFTLFQQTAKREKISIRPKEYFQNLLEILDPKGYADLLVAYYNGNPIAAEIVTFYGETASYLYGASSSQYRNVMAPYLLHWEAMKRAKEKGCKFYDLLAVAPEGSDDNHKYAGITRFKEQFGGRKVHLVGGWDLVYKPGWYRLFRFAEKIRR